MVLLEVNGKSLAPKSKIENLLRLAQAKLKIKSKQIVSLAFVSPREIRRLNKLYREKNKVTDVLSFGGTKQISPDDELGEIIICLNQAKKQAKEFKNSLAKEIYKLVLHGFLHLLGFDHEKEREAETMEKKEEEILRKFYAKH